MEEHRGRWRRKGGGWGGKGEVKEEKGGGEGKVEKETRKGWVGVTQNILRRKMNELNMSKYTLNKSLSAVF